MTRTARSRCVACNQRHVEAYLCDRCAFCSTFLRRDDPRSLTATTLSKARTAAEVRATEADHLSAIQGIRDANTLDGEDVDMHGEPTFSPRNEYTAFLLYHNHLPHFTRKELTRWGEIWTRSIQSEALLRARLHGTAPEAPDADGSSSASSGHFSRCAYSPLTSDHRHAPKGSCPQNYWTASNNGRERYFDIRKGTA